ncbi:hypothetical protein P43SY_006394 [Pythium insidiosum]|uniref:Uncharacterized protein n=1 Tax=Pythium insidiosum TaxID=114742 RepID=A0AAD5LCP0_PYTIN|nr:hypothetical protein P43SY_006394 [Pythium insidiosum]
MALVAGSSDVRGAFWTTPRRSPPPPPTIPPANAPANPPNNPPSFASASASTSTSAASRWRRSSASDGSQQSSSAPSSASAPSAAWRRRGRLAPDVVLHVQHCAFALRERELQRRCRVLHEQLRRLRAAGGAGRDPAGDLAADKDDTTAARPPPFSPLVFEPRPRPPGLCQQRAAVDDRSNCCCDALATLSVVTCVQHTPPPPPSRASGDDDEELKPGDTQSIGSSTSAGSSYSSSSAGSTRWREEHSPGKENYRAATSSVNAACAPLVRPRAAAAPRSLVAMKRPPPTPTAPPTRSVASVGTQTSTPKPTAAVLHVELVAADAAAVAVLLEFLLGGKTVPPLPPATARDVGRLCRWLCLENRLLVVAMAQQLEELAALDGEWMDLLLQSARLRSPAARAVLLDRCLLRLAELVPPERVAAAVALSALPLHRLAALEDADVLARVLLWIVNRVRHLEVWARLTAALELWLRWSFRRPPLTPPVALRDVHASFAPWEPVISLAPVDVSGLDAYVRPTTLFRIGAAFAFQVRLEPDGLALMHWRVIRVDDDAEEEEEEDEEEEENGRGRGRGRGRDEDVEMAPPPLPSLDDDDDDDEEGDGHARAAATLLARSSPTASGSRSDRRRRRRRPASDVTTGDPAFTLRGRLCVRFRYGARGALLQQTVAIRYTHGPQAYGQWHVLLAAASPDAVVIAPPMDAFGGDPTADSDSDGDGAPDTQSPEPRSRTSSRTSSGRAAPAPEHETFELLAARFSGQFFAWGHRVCNLYHYLLLATLFYQAPADATPRERARAAAERMRELPLDTLLVVLASDRLRIPGGETTLVAALSALAALDASARSAAELRALFSCVRWCFVDLEQIMQALEAAPSCLRLYELIETQLGGAASPETPALRRAPWGVPPRETPYRANTTLIEFQIEAGDRSLSPSKFLLLAD